MPGPGDWYAVRRYQKETAKKWTELLEEQNRRQHAMFDELIAEAKKENKLIEEKALELIEHGAMHLLGIHHEH